jgi:branched-chain amino acid transport system substrate-binding protein
MTAFARRASGRHLPFAAGLMALALTAAGCGDSLGSGPGGGSGDDVKVGLLLPESGVYESLGKDMSCGWDLYLDEHDGKLGGKDVTVVRADEGEGPDVGVEAGNKLLTQDQVSVLVGVVHSATALGVKEAAVQRKVPFIVANAGAQDVADGSEYVWRTSFSNPDVGASLGKHVAESVDGPVYMMAPDYAAGHEFVEGFRETFEASGGEVAGESFTPFGTTSNWQPYLTKVKASGAKALYVFYAGGEAVKFVQQYSKFGLAESVPLYSPGFLTEGGVLAAQGSAAVGVQTALPYSNLLDTPVNAEFVEAYEAACEGAVPTVYAVQAYDAAAALDLALAEADGTDGESIAHALSDVGEIPSPRGAWNFDENHNPDQVYYLREVTDVGGTLGNVIVEPLTD